MDSINTPGWDSRAANYPQARTRRRMDQQTLFAVHWNQIDFSLGWRMIHFIDVRGFSIRFVFAFIAKIKISKRHSMTFIAAGEFRFDKGLAIESRALLCEIWEQTAARRVKGLSWTRLRATLLTHRSRCVWKRYSKELDTACVFNNCEKHFFSFLTLHLKDKRKDKKQIRHPITSQSC